MTDHNESNSVECPHCHDVETDLSVYFDSVDDTDHKQIWHNVTCVACEKDFSIGLQVDIDIQVDTRTAQEVCDAGSRR